MKLGEVKFVLGFLAAFIMFAGFCADVANCSNFWTMLMDCGCAFIALLCACTFAFFLTVAEDGDIE